MRYGFVDESQRISSAWRQLSNAAMVDGRITIDVVNSVPTVQGFHEGITFHRGHRPWITELVQPSSGLPLVQLTPDL
jgi:hypothetical protein